jgi:alpha-tubulin suppressor-like RCC1 family protein
VGVRSAKKHSSHAPSVRDSDLGFRLILKQIFPPVIESKVKVFDAGAYSSVFIKIDGSLWGMGENRFGKLGSPLGSVKSPRKLSNDKVLGISAGTHHLLFMKEDGTLWAKGDNSYGQLGTGDTNSSIEEVKIPTNGVVVDFDTSYANSFFVLSDGSLWGMGANFGGQMGDGNKTSAGYPAYKSPKLIVSEGVIKVVAASAYTMFLKRDGSVWATGQNKDGNFGNGTKAESLFPVKVIDKDTVDIDIYGSSSADGSGHSIILKNDGSLWGAGANWFGELGISSQSDQTSFVKVVDSNVTSITCGLHNTFFTKNDGSLWGMGYNLHGQLGLGNQDNQISPKLIVSTGVADVSAGSGQMLFSKFRIDSSGNRIQGDELWGTGRNLYGSLGQGNSSQYDNNAKYYTPVLIDYLKVR